MPSHDGSAEVQEQVSGHCEVQVGPVREMV